MSSGDIPVAPYKPEGDDLNPSDEGVTENDMNLNAGEGGEEPSDAAAAAAAAEAAAITEAYLAQQTGKPTTPNKNNNNNNNGVEVAYHEPPEIMNYEDHFTLLIPTSTIRFRDGQSAARVIESTDAQFVLEETYNQEKDKHTVSIRRIEDNTSGVQMLRLIYAIVTAFWTGFLFVFCLQVLLFLFLDLAIQAGATTKQDANWGGAIGAILAFPGFVYGLSCALVIAGAYIRDTWKGHYLIRNFAFKNVRPAVVEWIFFSFFLGLPILCLALTLLSGVDNWWEITSLFWFGSIVAFYVIFTVNVIFFELSACWEVTKNMNHQDNDGWFDLITRSIVSRQKHTYSGRQTRTYLAIGTIQDAEYTDSNSERNKVDTTDETSISFLTKLTMWEKFQDWGYYERLPEKSERIYSIDDARDVRPYVTSHTWSLEKIFCKPRNSRYIAIIRGPGALTQSQLKSSIVCSVVGTLLMFFVLLAIMVYLQFGAVFTILGLIAGFLVCLPSAKATYKLYKMRVDLSKGMTAQEMILANPDAEAGFGLSTVRSDDDQGASECVYFVKEQYRLTRPTNKFCWIMFILEVAIFFVYPLVALFSVGNYPLAIMFLVIAGITGLRYYVNAAVVLEQTGRMDLVDKPKDGNKEEYWKSQSRMNEIVGNITRGRSLHVWMSVLGFLGFIFLALMLGAVGQGDETSAAETSKIFTYDYEYRQQDSLRYPTCRLSSSQVGESPLKAMADYAFLAGLAYRSEDITQEDLDGWFNFTAYDDKETVEDFRNQTDTSSAVSFKLVRFNESDYSYVLIRGTTNNWDMLTDAQLWSAAALMQVHREILPFGLMWSPIIDQLIKVITRVESASIDSVSFYRDTTAFVKYLQERSEEYGGIGVTGHSLGGGLSIITGAQTGVPAVALSGPNAMLSRQSFDPPISKEDLDSKTFNIIPARDLVPMIDDVAQNYQGIRCQAEFADVIGCHNSIRSLCEIMYSCGSQGRPFMCACMTEFGYDPPEKVENSTVTESIEEICGIAK